jgi:hypothetical protein
MEGATTAICPFFYALQRVKIVAAAAIAVGRWPSRRV